MGLCLLLASGCSPAKIPSVHPEAETMYQNRLTNMPSSQYGDPFILRHDGYYYLYTTPAETVLQVQRSEDLLHWEMRGTITSDSVMNHAYAPEVLYYNGKFYLVASPSGNGHYILSSSSPEGPFVRETGNFGMNIDGSIFLDDDGSMTFYNATMNNIEARSMSSPTKVDGRLNALGTSMLHWTEGPFVMKRGGIYYLTYTGSHFLSTGYRVSYATSTVGPAGPFETSKDNPILLSTKSGFSNLGHSASFLGPDLDSWYMVYHDMHLGARGMDLDRLSFNGKRLYVSGPTDFAQPAPAMPQYAGRGTDGLSKISRGEDTLYVTGDKTGQVFSAEYNFTNGLGAGVVWGYQDQDNFWTARWNGADRFDILEVAEGTEIKRDSFTLPAAFDPAVLHTIRLASDGNRVELWFDNMQRYAGELTIAGGAVGYVGTDKLTIGYTAFSDQALGSSDRNCVYNLPSSFAAVNHAPAEKGGASDKVTYRTEDTSQSVQLPKGGYISFAVNTGEAGLYQISLECADGENTPFTAEIYEDGKRVGKFSSDKLFYASEGVDGWKTIPLGTVSLSQGVHTLSLRISKGTLDCRTVHVAAAQKVESASFPLTEKNQDLTVVSDQNGVRYSDQGMRAAGTDVKVMTAAGPYTDFSAKVTVSNLQSSGGGETGLVVRMSNPSAHDHQLRAAFTGYIATVNGRNITLRRNNYEIQKKLGAYRLPEAKNEIELEIRAQGASISVYVDGEAVIEVLDPSPLLSGGAGLVFTSEDTPVSAVYKDLIVGPLPK